ncbi:uncharacterized protein PGTG_09466 [Puccinia graminis f. sp. tritici CRL 75-36-700-3]|uniref:Uncharacterized protein n=1 Tax=Puccinia graminis f. sp. tritici (strain CRL 75-36-700-3 / race SCCL) TaxID=418459 RepID=E3KHH8_PUCGT|nr:uncharacterized protein PGTG_09466 [Puccinia graminis f. sp. tritici CRL 75-36-700-3]EFP83753.1 hypothetical protein PGTG_09466 [Puccinia graminis f. sp. tritici CRL 75-36-700-3]
MALLKDIPVESKANKLPDELVHLEDNSLVERITTRSVELYRDQPKELQVKAVFRWFEVIIRDDQVREKKLVNISAINLTKMSLNVATIKQILKGAFSFVYLVSGLPSGQIRAGPGASGYPFGFGYPLTFSAKSDIRICIRWRVSAGAGGYPRGYPRISAP